MQNVSSITTYLLAVHFIFGGADVPWGVLFYFHNSTHFACVYFCYSISCLSVHIHTKTKYFSFLSSLFSPPPLSLAFLLYFAVIPQHGMYNRHCKYYMLPFIYQSKKMTANKRLFFFTKSKKWFFFLLFPFCSSCFCWIKKVKAATAILHIKRESKECYELAE